MIRGAIRLLRTLDPGVTLCVLGLLGIGLAALALASGDVLVHGAAQDGALASHLGRQFVFLGASAGVLIVVLRVPYLRWSGLAFPAFAGSLALLLTVLLLRRPVNGALRWIPLGPFSLQPAEFMKLALVMTLARMLMYRSNVARLSGLVGPVVLTFAPLALIAMQPDLGTAMVCVPVLLAMLFVAGARARTLALAVLAAVLFVPVAYKWVLKDYQKKRIETFLHPEQRSLEEGYQLMQSRVAIGAGGILGRAWSGDEEALRFPVPYRQSDFIFSVVGEQFGFAGTTALVLLELGFLFFAGRIAHRTREPFGRLLVTGILTYFGVQSFVNIGMTIGLAPVTGVPLPFVSYGGSSLLMSTAAAGLILNVARDQVPVLAPREYADQMGAIERVGLGRWMPAGRTARPGIP